MTLFQGNSTARSIGFLRVWVFGLWLAKIAVDPIQSIGFLPHDAYRAVGVLKLLPLDSLLAPTPLLVFRLLLCGVLLLAALGVATRPACALGAALLVVQQGLLRGFGPINHCEMALLYAAMLLPLFPCGDALALFPRRAVPASAAAQYRACAFTLAAMLCATYFLPSAHRVFFAPDLIFSGAMRRASLDNSFRDPKPWSGLVRMVVSTGWARMALWGALPFVTSFELLTPLTLVSRRFCRVFLVVMITFHVMAGVIMNVWFWENISLFLLLVDLDPILSRMANVYIRPANVRIDAGSA